MTWQEALDSLAWHKYHALYRERCADGTPDRERWRRHYIAVAQHNLQPGRSRHRPPVTEAAALLRRMRSCPFWSRDAGCGCSGGRCGLAGGAAVDRERCFECLRRYP